MSKTIVGGKVIPKVGSVTVGNSKTDAAVSLSGVGSDDFAINFKIPIDTDAITKAEAVDTKIDREIASVNASVDSKVSTLNGDISAVSKRIPQHAPAAPYYYYVACNTGSDDNDGLSGNKPFKTLAKAINQYNNGVTDLRISVIESGDYDFPSMTLVGCALHIFSKANTTVNITFPDNGTYGSISLYCARAHIGSANGGTINLMQMNASGGGLVLDSAQFSFECAGSIRMPIYAYNSGLNLRSSRTNITVTDCIALFGSTAYLKDIDFVGVKSTYLNRIVYVADASSAVLSGAITVSLIASLNAPDIDFVSVENSRCVFRVNPSSTITNFKHGIILNNAYISITTDQYNAFKALGTYGNSVNYQSYVNNGTATFAVPIA